MPAFKLANYYFLLLKRPFVYLLNQEIAIYSDMFFCYNIIDVFFFSL